MMRLDLHFILACLGLVLMLTALVLSFDPKRRAVASHLITGAAIATLGAVLVQFID